MGRNRYWPNDMLCHAWWRATVGLCLACGCQSPLLRTQSPDLEPVVTESQTASPLVGDLALPAGMNYYLVEGVGLVTGLDNTGSDPPPSPERDALLAEMQSHETARPQTILASKRTALVRVRAYLPPGVQKGDRVDVEVVAPADTDTTSLAGGWLMQARLRQVAMVYNHVRQGDVDALAGGDVVVDAVFQEPGKERPGQLLRGRVLGGGVSLINRKLGLALRENAASVRASAQIGAAINNRFYHYENGDKKGVARPLNSSYIELSIPPRYRHNIARYMRVIRSIPLPESPADRALRLQRLENKLLEPTTAAEAALELEAIGKEGIPALRKGLASSDPEVRFYAAEALAYLGEADAARPLAEAAARHRAFRWHALTAISTLDHVEAYDALYELLSEPSAETRYGAFRAMQVRNPRDPLVKGELLGDSFTLHVLPVTGEPMVHFSKTRRQEIVIFGKDVTLATPPFLLAGKRLMIKRHDADQLKVIRFEPGEEDQEVVCSNQLPDLIRTLAEQGARYEDVFQLIRAAKVGGYLQARLAVNAQPLAGRVFQRGEETPSEEPPSTGRSVLPVPELFRDRLDSDSSDRAERGSQTQATSDEPPASSVGSSSWWRTITSWWSADSNP
ncbi:MAG: flagellar P-ring protein FlgI [Pirellulaceae bacterium]|nr:MAG: flagellar P-ring protein FlgI [Pirellulaceae bacterium]